MAIGKHNLTYNTTRYPNRMPEANEMAPSRDINRMNKVWFQEPCRLPGSYHEARLVVRDQLDVTDLYLLLVMEYQSEKKRVEIVTYYGLDVKVRDRKKSRTWKSLSRIRFHSSKRPIPSNPSPANRTERPKRKRNPIKTGDGKMNLIPYSKARSATFPPPPTPQTCVFFFI